MVWVAYRSLFVLVNVGPKLRRCNLTSTTAEHSSEDALHLCSYSQALSLRSHSSSFSCCSSAAALGAWLLSSFSFFACHCFDNWLFIPMISQRSLALNPIALFFKRASVFLARLMLPVSLFFSAASVARSVWSSLRDSCAAVQGSRAVGSKSSS